MLPTKWSGKRKEFPIFYFFFSWLQSLLVLSAPPPHHALHRFCKCVFKLQLMTCCTCPHPHSTIRKSKGAGQLQCVHAQHTHPFSPALPTLNQAVNLTVLKFVQTICLQIWFQNLESDSSAVASLWPVAPSTWALMCFSGFCSLLCLCPPHPRGYLHFLLLSALLLYLPGSLRNCSPACGSLGLFLFPLPSPTQSHLLRLSPCPPCPPGPILRISWLPSRSCLHPGSFSFLSPLGAQRNTPTRCSGFWLPSRLRFYNSSLASVHINGQGHWGTWFLNSNNCYC